MFALGDSLLPVITPKLVLGDFLAVEPVLDVGAVDENAHVIPLAGWFYGVLRGRIDIVTGGGEFELAAVGMGGVIENLHFGSVVPRGDWLFRDMVEDAAV